jgi:hypothetical protein
MSMVMGSGRTSRRVLIGCCILACAGGALGQEQVNLAEIRKNSFPGIDRQRVQDWCQQRIKQLLASKEPLKDGPAFISEINGHIQAADATPAFKTGVVEALAAGLAAQYKPATDTANPASALTTVLLLTFLKNHDSPGAAACYKQAIKDAAPSVRLVAGEGLLRSKMSAQDWDALLPELQKQGIAETEPVVMDRIYRVLTMNGGPAVDKLIPVLMAILDARLTRFEQKWEYPVVADANVVVWLGGKYAQISNNQTKSDIVRRTARLLADAVYNYTQTEAGRDQRQQLERVVLLAERQLKVMAKPAAGQAQPDVTTAMTDGGADRNLKMEKEIGAWIGTAQVAGILNAAPFSFERGLAVKRPPPPASAPATTAPAR